MEGNRDRAIRRIAHRAPAAAAQRGPKVTGKVIAFPGTNPNQNGGVVHCWAMERGGFEIGQESSSGNSWGSFEQFDFPQQAVAAAYQLNREVYGGKCRVQIDPRVFAMMAETSGADQGDF
jgi:hypothetical protein